MKRHLGLAFAFVGLSARVLAQQIQVVVNGAPVQFEAQGPTMVGDRVLVPLRGVLQQMGARVDWDPARQTVFARRGDQRVVLVIGQNTASVDGQPVDLDVPAQIMNGSTMVPLRFVGEALGGDVHWDADSNTVTITGGGYTIPEPRRRDRHGEQPIAPPPPLVDEVPPNAVVPVSINISLTSMDARPGQRFTASVGQYPGLPPGCQLEGAVAGVSPQTGIELNFDTLIDAHGRRHPIHGQAYELQGPAVARRPNGQLIASGPSHRVIFADRGTGASLVPVTTQGSIHDPHVVSEIHRKGAGARPVTIRQGTTFGVRIESGVKIH